MATPTTSPFSGKVVIVTGSSAGMGKAIAVMYAARGASVCLCGRDKEKLARSVEDCVQASGHKERFISVAGDVTDKNIRNQIVADTVAKFGRLDVLVANAGVALPNSTVSEATEETYDTVMDINLKSVFFLVQTALPHLIKTKGNIVAISSLYSEVPAIGPAVYAMTKAALDHFIRCVAVSEGPNGVRANTVNPSYVKTEIVRNLAVGHTMEEVAGFFEELEAPNHPLEGRCLRPEEVAEAVLFLSSGAASFITGETLMCGGGRQFPNFEHKHLFNVGAQQGN